MSDDNTISATNRIRMNLARALSSSTRALAENMRFEPGPRVHAAELGRHAAGSEQPAAEGYRADQRGQQ